MCGRRWFAVACLAGQLAAVGFGELPPKGLARPKGRPKEEELRQRRLGKAPHSIHLHSGLLDDT